MSVLRLTMYKLLMDDENGQGAMIRGVDAVLRPQ